MYTNSLNMLPTYNSHMMKNSEWGACAYLTHSKYGRNGIEVTINNNGETFYTGGGAGESYKTNTNQSTTGNITGIYDLSGNAAEYTAGYNKAYSRIGAYYGGTGGNTNTTYKPATGSHFAYNMNGNSNKYVIAYSNNTELSSATTFADFTSGGKDVSHIGDGIHEIWVRILNGWFNNGLCFVSSGYPFFVRGGGYSYYNAGVFYLSADYGGLAEMVVTTCAFLNSDLNKFLIGIY